MNNSKKTEGIGNIASMMKRAKKNSITLDKDSVNADEKILILPLDKVIPDPDQPRKTFDEKSLKELADSLIEHGQLDAIVVKPLNDGKFMIIGGERRWRAAKIAGLKTIKATIHGEGKDKVELLILAIIHNIMNEKLPVIEEADFVQVIVDALGSQKEASEKLKRDKEYISKMCTIASLPDFAKEAFSKGKIKDRESLNNLKRLEKLNEEWAKKLVDIAEEQEGSVKRQYVSETLKRAKDGFEPVSPVELDEIKAKEAQVELERIGKEKDDNEIKPVVEVKLKKEKKPKKGLKVYINIQGRDGEFVLCTDRASSDEESVWVYIEGEIKLVDLENIKIIRVSE